MQGSKKVVIARLTAIRAVGVRTIIEIHEDATFSSFFNFYSQDGMRYSTKKLIRFANRNEGLAPWHRAYRMTPGLDVLAKRFEAMPQFAKVTIRILKRRAYLNLLEAAPDVLGIVKVNCQPDPRLMPKPVLRYPVRIPEGYTTISKRVSILTGRG